MNKERRRGGNGVQKGYHDGAREEVGGEGAQLRKEEGDEQKSVL